MRFSVDVLYSWKRRHEAQIARDQGFESGELERRDQLQKDFAAEPASALQVVLDEPENWQHFLLAELLRFRMRRQRQRREDLFDGFVFLPARHLSKYDFYGWMMERSHDISAVVETAVRMITGKLAHVVFIDKPNPHDILECAKAVEHICDALYNWECDVSRTMFPEEYEDFKPRMQGWTDGFFEQIERLPSEIAKPLREPPADGTYTINVFFSVPPGVEDFAREVTERFEKYG
jgi:hypothetical protein